MAAEHPAAWPRHVTTIRRVLLGQWANNDARLKALDALKDLEAEVMALQHENERQREELQQARRKEAFFISRSAK